MPTIKINKDHVASVFEAHKGAQELIITSDGNVFLPKHKSYALNHCKTFNHTHDVIKREDFEKCDKGCKHKSDSGETKSWQDLKFAEIVAFAQEKGIELTTRSNQGKSALIAELEAALQNAAPAPSADNENAEESDYTPVGGEETSKSEE